MIIRKTLASISGVVFLLTAPVAQAAAPRESAPVEGEDLVGNAWIPIVVALAVLAAILLVTFDDEEEPTSP